MTVKSVIGENMRVIHVADPVQFSKIRALNANFTKLSVSLFGYKEVVKLSGCSWLRTNPYGTLKKICI